MRDGGEKLTEIPLITAKYEEMFSPEFITRVEDVIRKNGWVFVVAVYENIAHIRVLKRDGDKLHVGVLHINSWIPCASVKEWVRMEKTYGSPDIGIHLPEKRAVVV